ncbi:MAG: peptide chain release factor N(5)-glutamine methyltransferase [Candidatus Saccharibacteria bacterium]
MTVKEALIDAEHWLGKSGIASCRLDAELLLAHIIDRDRVWLIAHDTEELDPEIRQQYAILVQKRTQRVPLVHLTRMREFYGLELEVTAATLTPRVETEQMVEWAIKYAPQQSHLIDIGTGSGAIAVAIGKHRPDIIISATEVSVPALNVAKANAAKHEVAIKFIESDLWDGVCGTYQTIVTNLPYLRDDAHADLMEEVKYEPHVALFGGMDGLDLYRKFLHDLPTYLEPNGFLFTECDPWQHEELISEAAKYGLKPIEQGYFILGFQLVN